MKHFLLIISIFANCIAQAGEPFSSEKFRQAAIAGIEEAQQKGFARIDGTDLNDVKKTATEIPLVHNPNLRISYENRRCAVWQKSTTSNGHIYLNDDCKNLNKDELKMLAFHEILNVHGISDKQYEVSASVFSGVTLSTRSINLEKLKQKSKDVLNIGGGGSTGVGGGGDIDDIIFKIEGLKLLASHTESYFLGIPKDILNYAILHMNVKPASDIPTLIEMRGHNVEKTNGAVVYVNSQLYRSKNEKLKGELALSAARLFLIYAADELGLVDENISSSRRFYFSDSLKLKCLAFPTLDSIFFWASFEMDEAEIQRKMDSSCELAFEDSLRELSNPILNKPAFSSVRVLLRDSKDGRIIFLNGSD